MTHSTQYYSLTCFKAYRYLKNIPDQYAIMETFMYSHWAPFILRHTDVSHHLSIHKETSNESKLQRQ